jgi:Type IV secretion system pilin
MLNLNQIQSSALGNKVPTDIGGVIGNILLYIFGAAAIALLIYLMLGGFQMMTSRGDPKAMQGAQAKITNALIGFVIIIIAFFVVQLLGQLLGLQNTFFGQVFGLK